jgi:hypothetical protein
MHITDNKFELVYLEKMKAHYCLTGNCNVMASSFLECNDAAEKEEIRPANVFVTALGKMQQRHPFLRACLEIDHEVDRMHLVFMDDEKAREKLDFEFLNVSNDLEFKSENQLVDECAKFNVKLFHSNASSLLWRAQLICYKQSGEIKYLLNLCLMNILTEGLNITTLSIELVNIINCLLTNQVCPEMQIRLNVTDDIYSTCKKLNLFSQEHLEMIEKLNRERQNAASNSAKLLFPETFRSQSERGFGIEFFKLDKSTMKKLKSICKLNRVKLNSYFYTALYYALGELFRENDVEFPRQVLFEFPATLRVRYEPAMEFAH